MSKLFAFELAVEVGATMVDGYYDEEQELWVGDGASLAGGSNVNTFSHITCGRWTNVIICNPVCHQGQIADDCHNDYTSDWDCDNSLPGPC